MFSIPGRHLNAHSFWRIHFWNEKGQEEEGQLHSEHVKTQKQVFLEVSIFIFVVKY